jgi:hypothetical protein
MNFILTYEMEWFSVLNRRWSRFSSSNMHEWFSLHIKNIFEDVYFTNNLFHITVYSKNWTKTLKSVIINDTGPHLGKSKQNQEISEFKIFYEAKARIFFQLWGARLFILFTKTCWFFIFFSDNSKCFHRNGFEMYLLIIMKEVKFLACLALQRNYFMYALP